MKKITISLLAMTMILPGVVMATLADDLSGKILLQVEANGEAWYVSPENKQRYFLGRPNDAFELMRELGVGVSTADLNKIQIADANLLSGEDMDGDALSDAIEDALGTDKTKADSDADGFNDKTEVLSGNNPSAPGALPLDENFAKQHAGKIFLQVEANGEAWYVNPADNKRYFLGRPGDAFEVMRATGLGVSNTNLNQITVSPQSAPLPEATPPAQLPPTENPGATSPANPETATYKVEFIGTWSSETHPNQYPSGAHFSPFVIYSHNGGQSAQIFESGEVASPGVEIMAETGSTGVLDEEIDTLIASDHAWERVKGGVFNSPGTSEREITFTQNYGYFTFVSMIAPSPDWFVTQSDYLYVDGEWLERIELEVITYDSGSDSGEEFTSSDLDTNPKEAITRMGDELQGLGKIVLTRIEE